MTANTDFIKGLIPAVITPMTEDQEVDLEGLEKMLEHQIANGVHGVFTVGTAGEFWALSTSEKERIFATTVRCANGRVPVYVGTGANTTREAVQLAEMAQEAGADCLSVITPSFITPDEQQMFAHYEAIAESVGLPILLYTNPDRTNNKLSVDLVVRLAEQVENVVGIKDSAGDMALTAEYLRRTPADFLVLIGRDSLIYAGLMHGAVGAIAASANMAPELSVGIYENYVAGRLPEALSFQRQLAPLRSAFGIGTFPAMLKGGAELMNLPSGPPRAPVGRLSPDESARLREVLLKMGKLTDSSPDGRPTTTTQGEPVSAK